MKRVRRPTSATVCGACSAPDAQGSLAHGLRCAACLAVDVVWLRGVAAQRAAQARQRGDIAEAERIDRLACWLRWARRGPRGRQ